MLEDSRELLIGVVAIVALAADVDSFTLRQVLLGLLLLLFLLAHWRRNESTYSQVVYASVAGCCGLLVLGFPVQELLAAQALAHWTEEGFVTVWVIVSVLTYITRRATNSGSWEES